MSIDNYYIWRPFLAATNYPKHFGRGRLRVVLISKGICLGLLAAGFIPCSAGATGNPAPLPTPSHLLSGPEDPVTLVTTQINAGLAHHPKRADFKLETMSPEARYMADWVVDSGDNLKMSFVIVDKKDAKVFVFDADGGIRGASPALLGLALGDDSVPDIGERALSSIRPEERTTPSGRFMASLDHNLRGKEILWVDYAGAISLHPVISTNLKERRLQRLASPTPLDNRISYGCINVSAIFFVNVVQPAFALANGIVYVLPETKLNSTVFGSYDVDEQVRL